MKRGSSSEESAFVDDYFPVLLNGQVYSRTVRTTGCELLAHESKCESCKAYRSNLRSLKSRKKQQLSRSPARRTSSSSHVNFRYLSTPEKVTRMRNCSTAAKAAKKEVQRLKQKILEKHTKEGIPVDDLLGEDLSTILHEKTDDIRKSFAPGTFQRLFWDQQLEALNVRDRRQVRWHPMIIKWCLSMKLMSTSSYDALRSSNVVVLPSARTLRDYTHFVKAQSGFSPDVDHQLQREAKLDSIADYQRHVCLVFDEVKIKEDLVYHKHTGELIGFTNIGDINEQLSAFEKACMSDSPPQPQLATHMLVFMVSGILSDLQFPYAQFPTTSITADQLYSLVWGCVRRIEAAGLKVLAVTCDGASPNRNLFKLKKGRISVQDG